MLFLTVSLRAVEAGLQPSKKRKSCRKLLDESLTEYMRITRGHRQMVETRTEKIMEMKWSPRCLCICKHRHRKRARIGGNITPIVGNQMEEKTGHEMETRCDKLNLYAISDRIQKTDNLKVFP